MDAEDFDKHFYYGRELVDNYVRGVDGSHIILYRTKHYCGDKPCVLCQGMSCILHGDRDGLRNIYIVRTAQAE